MINTKKTKISNSGLISLSRSIAKLTKLYNEHFEVLNNLCISGKITQQEFFTKQDELANIIRELKKLKSQVQVKTKTRSKYARTNKIQRNQIRDDFAGGNWTQTDLSKIYCVSQATISAIVNSDRE